MLARVHELVDPMLAARRVELVELMYRREGPQMVLRFLVDTSTGITVQQCRELNQAIGAVLDEHDVVPERYCLEVASPGVDRPLKTERDFERVLHRRVRLALREPVEGLWTVVGAVEGVGDAVVTVAVDHGPRLRILLAGIVSATQEVTF
ncbi:MAG: ribosome maturation factor RimP [Candidatus Omnitrophica bacterium]|nr:ribosome maturation factor RimP [Candidatus Omnitrophota bacterium]